MSVALQSQYSRAGAQSWLRGYRLCILLLALANLAFLAAFVDGVFNAVHWFDEDGPAELLQAFVLLAGGGVALRQGLREQREGRIIDVGIAAMLLASFVREFELRGTGAPDWLVRPFWGTGQNIVILAIFAAFALTYVRRWREIPVIVRALLTPRTALYLFAAAVLLLSGIAEGSEGYFGNPAEVAEEWLELNGYLLFLAAIAFYPYRDRLTPAAR